MTRLLRRLVKIPLRWLLVLPFVVPVVAVAAVHLWAHVRQPAQLGMEAAGGAVVRSPHGTRLVLWDERHVRAVVLDRAGRPLGLLAPDAVITVRLPPLRHGAQLLYLGTDRVGPLGELVLGRLPLEGGRTRPRRVVLPAPVPLKVLKPDLWQVGGPRPVVLACGGHFMVRTEKGWARVSADQPRARLAPRPASGCEPLRPRVTPELPLPTTLYAETRTRQGVVSLGASSSPLADVLALGPERRAVSWIAPAPGRSLRGEGWVLGQWVVLLGRSCPLGQLQLTLAQLEGQPRHSWTVQRRFDPHPGCRATGLSAPRICGDQLQLPGAAPAFALESGEPSDARPGARCRTMRPLRARVPAWRGGRRLRHGGVLYLVQGAALEARRGARRLWRTALPRPAVVVGATGRDLLLNLQGGELWAVDLRSGAVHSRQQLSALHDPLEQRPSRTRWIGQQGQRGYFLLVRSRAWLQRLRQTSLVIFDGHQARLVH